MNSLEVKLISKICSSGEAVVYVLKSVSFSAPKGEFVAIVGESGPSKSTLLDMIGAPDIPISESVLIDGRDILSPDDSHLTIFWRRNIGFIFQSFNLIPGLNVE